MSNVKSRKARLKINGATIEVYRSSIRQGKWINTHDCKTEYFEYELEFIN